MVSMYPHKLYVVPVSSSRNADGYVVSQEGEARLICRCRLETQGKESVQKRDDGEQDYTSAVIYIPSTKSCLCNGTLVSVRDACGKELIRKKVVNCLNTQLHTRIWV